MSSFDPEVEDTVVTKRQEKTEEKVEEPPLYKVVLHNDDFTPMEFVVSVLLEVFHFSRMNAVMTMLKVHIQGTGVIGVYTYEIAETKVMKATRIAGEQGYPLLLTIEEDIKQ
jgi:ATP-dependent Clp protease adaptor protein ClpS